MGHGNRHDDEPHDDHHEGDDDEAGDDLESPASRRLPDPLDRLWVHPTELSALGAAFAGPGPRRNEGRRRSRVWVAPALAGAAGAIVTIVVLGVVGAFNNNSTDSANSPAADATTAHVPTPAETIARLAPSIVAVVAVDGKGARHGSGVCVRHGSQVLTSTRVVGDAATVQVVTSDGTHHAARVAGRDRVTNLALLDLDGDTEMPAAPLAGTMPTTGAPVWIVGSARGATSPWMSHGMASSTDALLTSSEGPTLAGLLEIDGASNASVVGGALVDASGSVAGIVLGRVNGSATVYAVDIGVAVDVAHQLDADGVARHGELGVSGIDTPTGPMIVKMPRHGAAAQAGIRVDDRVESVDGRAVSTVGDLIAVVRSLHPGDTAVVDLRRGKSSVEARVRLGATTG
jgi:S1-C subfamily serine protease